MLIARRADCYGYVRGALKPGGSVHVPGLGDFAPESIEVLDDPLPLISKTSTLEKSDSCHLRAVAYDDDAVYIAAWPMMKTTRSTSPSESTVVYSKDEVSFLKME